MLPSCLQVAAKIRAAARDQDPAAALAAYDAALAEAIPVKQDSFNSLLFLCAGGDSWAAPQLTASAPEGGAPAATADFHALYARGQAIFGTMAEQGELQVLGCKSYVPNS